MITISLVIPTYNEDGRIKKTLYILKKGVCFYGLKLKEIIFSDDGSNDETTITLRKEKRSIERKTKAKVKILIHPTNKGRGYAIRKASLISRSDYVLYADADFSIPLTNLKRFIPYLKKDYDLIIGSKKIPGAYEVIKRSLLRRVVGYSHTIIASVILGVFVWDYQGGFKLFSKKFVDHIFPYLQIDRWGFDMEVIFLAKKLEYKIAELPVRWEHIENGSKVKLIRDIIRSFQEMLRIKVYWLEGKYQKYISPRFALRYS